MALSDPRSLLPTLLPTTVAFVALAVSVLALRREPPTVESEVAAPASPELEDLGQRLAALEARAATPVLSGQAPARREEARAPASDPAIAELRARVERLEAQQQNRQATAPPPRAEEDFARLAAQAAARSTEDRARAAPAARQTILDPLAAEADKLKAWAQLRHAGKDAWTDAVVLEMTRIGLGSPNAVARADVWRQADGHARSDRLVPALLQAVVHDTETKVREEAAETLVNYLDSPGVRATLESTAANDVDDGVRRQARSSLGKR